MPVTMDSVRQALGPAVTVVGVIGSPVAHSLSPLLHASAFSALGLGDEWRSFAFEVPPGGAADALEAMRRDDIRGVSVTMPHKADVVAGVDECSAVARRLGAVNCVVNRDGSLWGTNTDGEGFVSSLRRGAGLDPAGCRCVVVGAGGAARAVVLSLAQAGAAEVAIVNRTPERAYEAAALADPVGAVVPLTDRAIAEAVVAADLVVNATPVRDGRGGPGGRRGPGGVARPAGAAGVRAGGGGSGLRTPARRAG